MKLELYKPDENNLLVNLQFKTQFSPFNEFSPGLPEQAKNATNFTHTIPTLAGCQLNFELFGWMD